MMKKYKIYTSELQRRDVCYSIEAESKEDAKELFEFGEGDVIFDDYDCIDDITIIKIEEEL